MDSTTDRERQGLPADPDSSPNEQAGAVPAPPSVMSRPRAWLARWIMAGVLAAALVSVGATWWLSRTEPARQSFMPGAIRHSLLTGSMGGERSFAWGCPVDGRPGGVRWNSGPGGIDLQIEIEPASDLLVDLEYDGRILECAGVTPNFWRNKSWVDIGPGRVRMNLPGIGKRVVRVQLQAVEAGSTEVWIVVHRGGQVLFRKAARFNFS